jgi:NAD(P)-dependent dehydrogenase (short-subunit alcohol dehydrogenase family)
MSLDGKVALVTGAGRGMGRATALALANDGASVAVTDILADAVEETATDVRATGQNSVAISADIGDGDDIDRVIANAVSALGRVDILVNNAGITRYLDIMDITEDDWDRIHRVNARGAFFVMQRTARQMIDQGGGGRIVNITTPGGKAPGAGSVPTSVSRAAGIALTKEMSKDYAGDNILVNTVCIGLIKAGQHERRWESAKEQNADLTLEAYYEEMGKRVPIGRVGEAREAGDLVTFLVSDRAAYITGVAVNIDGGTSPVV